MILEEMTIQEYAINQCNVLQRLEHILKDPITLIEEQDQLPFDEVINIDGALRKVVYADSGEPIPIVNILGVGEKDLHSESKEFQAMWHIYMANVSSEDMSLENIISMAQELRAKTARDEELRKCIES